MPESAATHYLNSDFDLSLRPRPGQLFHAKLERQTRELTAQALLGADEGDAALVRVEIPEEFLDYLGRCGVPTPRVFQHPESDPSTVLSPFGWNAEAVELNRRHHCPVEHPSLDCIRTVNSRSFALALERELFCDTSTGTMVGSAAELDRFLGLAAADTEWIVKSEFGNAGLANRHLRSTEPTAADRRFVEARLAEDDRLLVEPYRRRLHDWSVVFDVPFDSATLRFHETQYTRDGALIGSLFQPASAETMAPYDGLGEDAEQIAAHLARAGYVGPVCVDSFSYGDPARPEVRPLVDLNCRRAFSDGVYRLWRRLAPVRALYFRTFGWSKLRLPDDLRDAVSALGDTAYDPGRRRGILLGSPTRFGPAWPRPFKLAVLFLADDRSKALELERGFRDRFEVRR